jgi:hypothetical protein
MTRFAPYGDVAGYGGASAGSKWSSSVNPTALGWLDIEGKLQTYTSGQYSRVWFKRGTRLDVFAESVLVDLDEWGSFLVAAAQIESNRSEMTSGYDFYLASDQVQLGWAKKFTKDWGLGIALNYSKSVCRNDYGTIPVDQANSDTYTIRLGGTYQITEKLLGGLVLDYGWSEDRTCWYAIPAWGMPEAHERDTTRQFLVRPGVSFEYVKDSFLYLDYQFGTFWNDTGTLNVHRVYTGVEHGLNEWIFARVGTAIDPCASTYAVTCGLGFYPATWFSVDVGYQYDMLPEVVEEFGRSHIFNVSVSFTF